MLKALKEMIGLKIHATDGEIGHLSDFLFEDSCWQIRYLVIKAGKWYSGEDILISPTAIDEINWQKELLSVSLSKQQIDDSPKLKSDEPVSRRYEKELFSHYSWPLYWGYDAIEDEAISIESEEKTHVRSVKEVIGYEAKAIEGQLGSVKDLVVNFESWAIKYFIVGTGFIIKHAHDLAGKDVIIPAGYLKISWAEKDAKINLPLDIVKSGPEFDKSASIDSDFEKIISDYYDLSGQEEVSENCEQKISESSIVKKKEKLKMKCSEIMTQNPSICFPEDDIQKAVGAMWDGDCGGIPVVNNSESKELIGMVTDRDAAICVIKHMNTHPSNVKVKDCMSSDAFSCSQDDSVESVIQMMAEHQIRRVPIVDEHKCCVGIISQSDLISHVDELGCETIMSALQRISMSQMVSSTT